MTAPPRCEACVRDATHGVVYVQATRRWHACNWYSTKHLRDNSAARRARETRWCRWHAVVEAHLRNSARATHEA